MDLTRQQKYDAKRYAENPNYRKERNAARRAKLGDTEYRKKQTSYVRKCRLGATEEWVAGRRELQRGGCAICMRPLGHERNQPGQECVDHCHETGRLRGLLCRVCNTALGFYERQQKPFGLVIEPYERYLSG